MKGLQIVSAALLLGMVQVRPELVPFGADSRRKLEKQFFAVPFWKRSAWARIRYETLTSPETYAERYSKGQYLRLWQAVFHSGAPKRTVFPVLGDDGESRRLDLLCNRLSGRDLKSIREAQVLYGRNPGDLMLATALADVTALRNDVPYKDAIGYGNMAVRLAPEEPLARLARGVVCFNRCLMSKMPGKNQKDPEVRAGMARQGIEDFEWFLDKYRWTAPPNDPYATGYVNVLDACVRILQKEATG